MEADGAGGGLAKSCTTEGSMSGVTSDLAMPGSGWRCCSVSRDRACGWRKLVRLVNMERRKY